MHALAVMAEPGMNALRRELGPKVCNVFQDKVGSRTLEGRRLRRHVLKGAVIVFITAGYSGKRFIFEKVPVPAGQPPALQ